MNKKYWMRTTTHKLRGELSRRLGARSEPSFLLKNPKASQLHNVVQPGRDSSETSDVPGRGGEGSMLQCMTSSIYG